MSEIPTPSTYIPFACPHCKHLNNLLTANRCEECGLLFRRSATEPPRRALPDEPDEILPYTPDGPDVTKWAVRTAIVVAVLAIVAVSGIVVIERRQPAKTPPLLGNPVLPAAAWHRPSVTNLFRAWPTREEIVARGIRANGAAAPSEIITLVMTGEAAVAFDVTRNLDVAMDEEFRSGRVGADGPTRPESDATGAFEMKFNGRQVIRSFSAADRRHATTEVFDGEKAARISADGAREAVEGGDLEILRHLAFLTDRTDTAGDYVFEQIVGAGEKVAFGLRDARPGRETSYFFDAESGLPTVVEAPNMRCYLGRYAPTGGVNLPSDMRCRFVTSRNKVEWLFVTNAKWQVNPAIESGKFEAK